MASRRRLLRELHDSSDLPDSILCLHPLHDSDLYSWTAVIHPPQSSNSYYKDGYFQLAIEVPQSYPIDPPKISFVVEDSATDPQYAICTKIPHCNIDFKTGEICLDILKPNVWSPAWSLKSAMQAILLLLDNQEPDSPLNVDMANLFRLDDQTAIKSIINFYIHCV